MFIYRQEYYEERSEPKSSGTESSVSFHERYVKWQERWEQAHNLAEILVAKQRHGPIGTVKLHFEADFTHFRDHIDDVYLPEPIS